MDMVFPVEDIGGSVKLSLLVLFLFARISPVVALDFQLAAAGGVAIRKHGLGVIVALGFGRRKGDEGRHFAVHGLLAQKELTNIHAIVLEFIGCWREARYAPGYFPSALIQPERIKRGFGRR